MSRVSVLSFILAIDSSLPSSRFRLHPRIPATFHPGIIHAVNYMTESAPKSRLSATRIWRISYAYMYNLQSSQLQVYIRVSSYLSQCAKARAALARVLSQSEGISKQRSMERLNRRSRADKRMRQSRFSRREGRIDVNRRTREAEMRIIECLVNRELIRDRRR